MKLEMGLIFVSFIFLAGQFGYSNGECGTEVSSCNVTNLELNEFVSVQSSTSPECYENNTEVTLTCQPGTITGPQTVTCTNGNWGPVDETTCTVVCPSVSITDVNVELSPNKTTYNVTEILTFSCKTSYKLADGSSSSYRCLNNGTWLKNGAEPACVAFNCSGNVTDENLILDPVKDIYFGNETVTFSCSDEFTLKGEPKGRCTDQDTWMMPTCESSGNVAHLLWYLPVMTIPYTLLSFTM